MPGSNRDNIAAAFRLGFYIVTAFALLVIIWQISGHYTERRQRADHHASQYSESANLRIASACGGLNGPALVECVAEEVRASREDERTEYDLKAQQDSASAAFWMAIISFLTLGTTIVALWFVKGTLEATREAVKDTGEATDAMREANEIARNANFKAAIRNRAALGRERELDDERRAGERRQLRAYVDFESVKQIMQHKTAKPRHTWRGVRIVLKNFGQTPADKLDLKIVYYLQPRGGDASHISEHIKTDLGAIMPQDSFRWSDYLEMSDEQWQSIGNEQTDLLASVVATYVDAFGEPHTLASTYITDGWTEVMGFVPGTRITG